MKNRLRFLVGPVLAVALVLAYTHRQSALSGFTSFGSTKKKRFHDSTYAKDYNSALDSSEQHSWLRAKIAWDLWCIQMSADVNGPKKKDGRIFFIIDATDRTDTRCIYVFDADGQLLEVAFQPLA